MADTAQARPSPRTLFDMNGYQWLVIFAAWLGWGFDCFDALLFNYVAPNCVPALLGLRPGTPLAARATLHWTGLLTSLLLLGWAAGGILFGRFADRIGRARTLMLTMLMYALGTAACAMAPNIWVLIGCRVIASLGIGGEWAAGASMVAEVVPEKRRAEAGAVLYTSAAGGIWLASFLAYQVQGVYMKASPETAWRYVFLCGLIPAAFAFVVRQFVREPERWTAAAAGAGPPSIRELFAPAYRRLTLSGFAMAVVALISWWSCSAFIAIIGKGLAAVVAHGQALAPEAARLLAEQYVARASNYFNVGGVLGTILTVPISKIGGRRVMFGIYYAVAAVSIFVAFGANLSPEARIMMYLPLGLSVFGVFGSFVYYLPELFPTRLRGTGAGFCYNVGRILAAAGTFVVGDIASSGAASLGRALQALTWVAAVPVLGILALPVVVETKGRALAD